MSAGPKRVGLKKEPGLWKGEYEVLPYPPHVAEKGTRIQPCSTRGMYEYL